MPAKVQGTWLLPDGNVTLTQSYQALQGTMTRRGATSPISQARMRGDRITFIAGGLTYNGMVRGDVMEGTATTPSGTTAWRATRRPVKKPRRTRRSPRRTPKTFLSKQIGFVNFVILFVVFVVSCYCNSFSMAMV